MDPFLGEIKLLPWNWPPKGWHLCDGTLLSIQQNSALFSLLGTYYGGNGTTTFALPDLRGRTPIHYYGSGSQLGTMTGTETVTLTISQMPTHNHTLQGTSQAGNAIKPFAAGQNNTLAKVGVATDYHYAPDTATTALNPASIQPSGNNQAHNNMQPYLVLNYCIATSGVYPSRN